jgi:plasmid maintenance system antidote protein VapI
MNTTKDRLVAAFDSLRFQKKVSSQTDFGEKIGYNKSHVSELMNGRKPVTNTLAVTLQTKFGIRFEWLMNGEGEMFYKDAATDSETVESEKRNINSILQSVEKNDVIVGLNSNNMLDRHVSIIEKQAEQMDRLITIIEKMSSTNKQKESKAGGRPAKKTA